jgi:glycyl-tRNA synthetase (class II)
MKNLISSIFTTAISSKGIFCLGSLNDALPEGQPVPDKVKVLLVAVHNDELSLLENVVQGAQLEASFYEIEIFSTIRSVVDEPVKPVRAFNLLVKSNLGDFTGEGKDPVYLPGEACQGIYLNFKNVVNSTRMQIPFGIAQIGKAFRNEISPRNFLFRTRELEQADTQYFVKPNENKEEYEKIKQNRFDWYVNLGIKPENLKLVQHENLVFYAKDAWDIEYNFPTGFDELEGIHDRSDYDLTQHMKYSGTDLHYIDPYTGEKYIPWILETSVGLGRMFLA